MANCDFMVLSVLNDALNDAQVYPLVNSSNVQFYSDYLVNNTLPVIVVQEHYSTVSLACHSISCCCFCLRFAAWS